jgi:uncharacterized protein (TIGR02246 family)
MIRPASAYLILFAATGCSPPAETRDESSTAEAAIEVTTESWLSAYERGDADALADLFEEDGMYAANTGEVLDGRAGIREGVHEWMTRRPPGVELDLEAETVRFQFDGDSAHSVSRFVIRAMPPGCTLDAGHALSVWRPQGDGNWLIATHLVNRDPQPPADACPPTASSK